VLTHYYRPEPNFITADVAEALSERAYVTVVTTQPSYPTGRVHPGFHGARVTRRVENGVKVWRVPHVIDRSTSPWRRGLSYGSFAMGAAFLAPFLGRADVIWVYHTPFTTALAALPVKRLYGARLVYTSADLWPESFVASNVMGPGRALDALYAYSRWILRFADDIVCSTRGTLERYAEDGVPRERLHYIPVWTEGIPEVATPAGVSSRAIVYTGNIGPAQGLESVVRAATLLLHAGADVHFAFYGTGSEEQALRELAKSLGATNVHFHGRVSASEAFEASARALAQIVSLRDSPSFEKTVPSKLFTAMAAGTPILAGLHGEALATATATGGAIPYDSGDAASLARAVTDLLDRPASERERMGQVLRDHYRFNYGRNALIARYRELLLAAPSRQPSRTPPDGHVHSPIGKAAR
jgi:colanic acid biosynthesis glycosyl transferase WcaI